MSGSIEDPMQCEAIQDDLPEMAFGTLSGRRRSEILVHVGICLRCSADLERLSTLADALLQLAPRVEPPLGFELRLAERLRATAIRRSWRLWRVVALSAAAMAMVILGFGLGAGATAGRGNSKPPSATANLTTVDFTSSGRVVGELMISRGDPAWIFIAIRGATAPGLVMCEVTLGGGRVETIGVFRLSGEYAAWGAPLGLSSGQVRSARLVASNGSILASAQVS